MTQRAPNILLAGGGTGGHVYPAIAIADALRAQVPDANIAFVGTEDRVEATAVPKAGYTLYPITVQGFQRALTIRNLYALLDLVKGFVQSWNLVRAFRPDVAVGTGGYVAGPALLAAWMQGCPVVIQEQNAYVGVTNRLLAFIATQIHVAFPEAERYVPARRTVRSGNPVRQSLTEATRAQGRRDLDLPEDARVLLVFGGSLGSEALNTAMERHVQALLDADDQLRIIWQTGSRYFEALRDRVSDHPRLHLLKYINRMDLAYAAADLALCRAGAITCSELMVTGTPALLVPSPNVVADHQTKNARSMTHAGAAELLPEAELSEQLVARVTELVNDDARRAAMTEAAKQLARPDAATRIARAVLRLVAMGDDEDDAVRARHRAPTP